MTIIRKKQDKLSAFLIVVWLINIAGSLAVTSYFVSMIAKKQYHPYFLSPKLQLNDSIQQSAKIFATHLILVLIFGQLVNIITGRTGDFHRSIVNTGNNAIAQTIIFAGFFYQAKNQIVASQLYIPLLDLFLVGRILFSLGYSLGTCIGLQSFRAYGFGFNVACILITLSFTHNFELLNFFKHLF